MTVWSVAPALGYLAVLSVLLVAFRRSAPPLRLIAAVLLVALGVRVGHGGTGALIPLAVAVGAAVPVTALVPRVVSPFGALSMLGAAACLPLGNWWLLGAGWALAAVFALVVMLVGDGPAELVKLSMSALPVLGVGPDHLSGQRVLPHKPSAIALGDREELVAANASRVYLAPWLLATVLAAWVITAR